ncbi:DUF459 domain-containing protein [Moraxella nasovis]|uniref:SGNH/GDSL hydrolase family protein n=1 Tax=Moraxella nasovis TaxID=2904121 RepID=UPI001F604292|nr:DUF459 domain-containing protein [Moraxella nasovis]UNU73257.1 DUF459 domain-containing protein [Moraxella nasovis]
MTNTNNQACDKANNHKVAHVQLTKHRATTGHIMPKGSVLGALVFLMVSAAGGIWLMQNSINAYYIQTYHTPSPMASIDNPAWRLGGKIGNELYARYGVMTGHIAKFNELQVANFNANFIPTPTAKQIQQTADNPIITEPMSADTQQDALDDRQAKIAHSLTINSSQKVLFAGDSMMQGIAPHIQKHLQSLGIDSVNLSKQSTGLAYPKLFDWSKTIKEALTKDSSIKVLMVMLGPNDPWDMPASDGRYLKFDTAEWHTEYQSRMADIINFATERGVGVIWITPPNMKKAKLNQQMMILNDVMAKELDRHLVKVIDSRPIMGGVDGVYHEYLSKDGKQIKMRTGDGIHFSVAGQKILANQVQSYLIINNQP